MFLSSLGECFRAVGAAEKASQPLPPLLLPLLPSLPRHGPKLSFTRMAFLELVTYSSHFRRCSLNKVKVVNMSFCKEEEAGVVK